MVCYQTLLEATVSDTENSKTAFEILSDSQRGDLDGRVSVRSGSEPRAQISQNTNLRIHIVDANIGIIDHKNAHEK